MADGEFPEAEAWFGDVGPLPPRNVRFEGLRVDLPEPFASLPDGYTLASAQFEVEGRLDVEWCLHPRAVQQHRVAPGGWAKRCTPKGWRLRKGRSQEVAVLDCPDCPAIAYQLTGGYRVAMTLAPWARSAAPA